ncbi:hypothetical protein BDY21DRAFT_215334 [Lineolata rhizophorae]|uniref:Uncharacterized protein n=1 Tax=Lineolata rhizophorae TaxID=578093 RepID=A0A6A6P396_9PEZI|nr:hypothetical protein BDY21DRAFT_215334 [Lineolata rhizophorae]
MKFDRFRSARTKTTSTRPVSNSSSLPDPSPCASKQASKQTSHMPRWDHLAERPRNCREHPDCIPCPAKSPPPSRSFRAQLCRSAGCALAVGRAARTRRRRPVKRERADVDSTSKPLGVYLPRGAKNLMPALRLRRGALCHVVWSRPKDV